MKSLSVLIVPFALVGLLYGDVEGSGVVRVMARSPSSYVSQWEKQMKTFGSRTCDELRTADPEKKLAVTYYDAVWIYYRIADHTRDKKWIGCVDAALAAYRDGYVFANGGKVPGFWVFPHGLWEDWKRRQDPKSKEALLLLANKAAFAYAPPDWTKDANSRDGGSREVAYALMTKYLAKDVGYTDETRIEELVSQAFGHMDQWFGGKTANYVRPFMVALTAEALIMHHARTGDRRVLPVLKLAADGLWKCCWNRNQEAMAYTDRDTDSGGQDPAIDLNLLIAPLYGWLYQQTGIEQYRERGDALFMGGVAAGDSYLASGKQFNQNYRWSFDYVAWRNKG